MSEQRPSPKPFMEHQSPAVQEHLRVGALAHDLRRRFATLSLHQAYALFRHRTFANWATPPLTEDGRNRKTPPAPEYPELRAGEDARAYKERVERFHVLNRAYKDFAREFVHDGVERLVEQIEKLNSQGEFFDPGTERQSTLQLVETEWQPRPLFEYAARLAGRWKPPTEPLPPAGTQFEMFPLLHQPKQP